MNYVSASRRVLGVTVLLWLTALLIGMFIGPLAPLMFVVGLTLSFLTGGAALACIVSQVMVLIEQKGKAHNG